MFSTRAPMKIAAEGPDDVPLARSTWAGVREGHPARGRPGAS